MILAMSTQEASYPDRNQDRNQVRNSDGVFESDPRWRLVERVAASGGFANAHRLSAFLRYVCRQSLAGQGAGLSERHVGEAVFGRKHNYDPRDDNIVRSHASRLRNRLEDYFENEGASESLRVYIPRGSYVPVFEETGTARQISAAGLLGAESAVADEDADDLSERERPRLRFVHVAALCLAFNAAAVAVWFGVAYFRNRPSLAETPSHKLWSALFRHGQETIIVPADSNLVVARLIVGHPVSLADYAAGTYRDQVECDNPCDESLVRTVEALRYTSMSDLEFAVKVSRLPEAIPDRTEIGFARDLELKDFKESNLILAGSQEADPWVGAVSGQMNFVVHDHSEEGPLRIENKKPRAGEKTEYLFDDHDRQHRGLATISFLPNLSGSGNLLVVQGFTSAGTQAAAEFVTSGKDFDDLFGPYLGRGVRLPHFEILLATSEVNGIASRPALLAWRTYP